MLYPIIRRPCGKLCYESCWTHTLITSINEFWVHLIFFVCYVYPIPLGLHYFLRIAQWEVEDKCVLLMLSVQVNWWCICIHFRCGHCSRNTNLTLSPSDLLTKKLKLDHKMMPLKWRCRKNFKLLSISDGTVRCNGPAQGCRILTHLYCRIAYLTVIWKFSYSVFSVSSVVCTRL